MDAERNGTMLAGEHKADLAKRVNDYLDHLRSERERLRPSLEDFMVRD